MLDKFAKIEEALNKAILKLMELLHKLFFKLTPKPLLNKIKQVNHGIRVSLYNIKAIVSNFAINSVLALKDSQSTLKIGKKRLGQKISEFKLKIANSIAAFKSFLLNSPLKTTISLLAPLKNKVKQKFSKTFTKEQAPQFVLAGSAMTMITLAVIAVAQQSRTIYQAENPSRKPASVQQYDLKPEYYYFKQQTTMVQNIKVPLQVSNVAQMDSLTIDFSVRTSTRYASYFLKENEHRLKDYFFTSVEPIVSDFALDEDGKEVLKEKIQNEIQNFLDKEKVEGEVLEVNLQYVIGS